MTKQQQQTFKRRHEPDPPMVTTPTEVRFDSKRGMKKREKFCFAAAAAGWHMGALVIDLDVSAPHCS